MATYLCTVCGYVHEQQDGPFGELADDFTCPVCSAGKDQFVQQGQPAPRPEQPTRPPTGPQLPAVQQVVSDEPTEYLGRWRRQGDELEAQMEAIHRMAETGASIIEPMRTRKPVVSWDDILIRGAQLARLPLSHDQPVSMRTVIGPGARQPLVLETPLYVSHMSFGALSWEAKIALAMGSAAVKTAICSGEGGILPEERDAAHRHIFEYVPNRYSVTEENLHAADAVEIKIGQSAKPGMGGHLPAEKVTEEIAAVRGFAVGVDITSPAHFPDIRNKEDLKQKVSWLREGSGGRPVGVKLAAGRVEQDLVVALFAGVDFITLDGRAGGTGAAPAQVKDATSVPTIYALHRAREFLDAAGAEDVSLVITGGLRVSADFAKALAMGADAVAVASAAMMALGCQQYRLCHTGKCPVGIATQAPDLRDRLDVELSARRVENYLRVCTEELATFARLTGRHDVHDLSVRDLCTTNSELSNHTNIEHA